MAIKQQYGPFFLVPVPVDQNKRQGICFKQVAGNYRNKNLLSVDDILGRSYAINNKFLGMKTRKMYWHHYTRL